MIKKAYDRSILNICKLFAFISFMSNSQDFGISTVFDFHIYFLLLFSYKVVVLHLIKISKFQRFVLFYRSILGTQISSTYDFDQHIVSQQLLLDLLRFRHFSIQQAGLSNQVRQKQMSWVVESFYQLVLELLDADLKILVFQDFK